MEITQFQVAVAASALFLAKMALLAFFGFDEGEFETEGIFGIFSVNKVLTFLMGYGFYYSEIPSQGQALACGAALALLYHLVTKKVFESVKKGPGQVDQERPKEGDVATVYMDIGEEPGKIQWNGRVYRAYSDGGRIKTGSPVVVKEIIGDAYRVAKA